jgi:hypothetical protein
MNTPVILKYGVQSPIDGAPVDRKTYGENPEIYAAGSVLIAVCISMIKASAQSASDGRIHLCRLQNLRSCLLGDADCRRIVWDRPVVCSRDQLGPQKHANRQEGCNNGCFHGYLLYEENVIYI